MTYKSRTEEEEILNHLLVDIVTANGGTIFSNDRISLLESWLAAISKIVFIDLDSTASAHYLLASPPEFAGDFEITVNVVGSDLTADQAIIDSGIWSSGTAGEILLFIDNPNGLDLLICNGSGGFDRETFGGQAAILNGELNKVSLRRGSGVITARLNNTQLGGSITNTSTIKFSQGLIGGGDARDFNGILSKPNLIDITTPANSLPFNLNQLTKDYELPTNNVFGSDVGGIISEGAGWTDVGGGAYDWSSGSSSTDFFVGAGSITALGLYQVDFTVSNYVGSGDFGVSATTTSEFSKTRVSGNGTVSVVIPIDGGNQTQIAFFARDSHTLTISDISVREVTNYITYENIATGAPTRDTYVLSSDGTKWASSTRTINIASQA
jgi:hypothetical protein